MIKSEHLASLHVVAWTGADPELDFGGGGLYRLFHVRIILAILFAITNIAASECHNPHSSLEPPLFQSAEYVMCTPEKFLLRSFYHTSFTLAVTNASRVYGRGPSSLL